jgi:hypothetical protein
VGTWLRAAPLKRRLKKAVIRGNSLGHILVETLRRVSHNVHLALEQSLSRRTSITGTRCGLLNGRPGPECSSTTKRVFGHSLMLLQRPSNVCVTRNDLFCSEQRVQPRVFQRHVLACVARTAPSNFTYLVRMNSCPAEDHAHQATYAKVGADLFRCRWIIPVSGTEHRIMPFHHVSLHMGGAKDASNVQSY